MGIEPTSAVRQGRADNGFEDREGHQPPNASIYNVNETRPYVTRRSMVSEPMSRL